MDDRKLESLLRLAIEADELERSATSPRLQLVKSRSSRPWLMPVAGVMAAAAAVVAVVTVVFPLGSPPAQPLPVANGHSPTKMNSNTEFDRPLEESTVVAATGEDEASVVMAFFEGIDGRCTCMHIQNEDWDISELADKQRNELLDVAYRSKCGSPTPSLVVVAIAGKREALPSSPEQAEALAAKLTDHLRDSRSDLAARAYQAVPGLPAGSMVVTESVGNRNTLADFAKFSIR